MAKPTHKLSAFNKDTQARGIIGSGWLQPDGSISITLNPCVCLTPHEDIVIKLFPEKPADEATPIVPKAKGSKFYTKPSFVAKDSDDEAPF